MDDEAIEPTIDDDVEWVECDDCCVVYPRHELVKCPGCGLLLCENCDPHSYSCENYAI